MCASSDILVGERPWKVTSTKNIAVPAGMFLLPNDQALQKKVHPLAVVWKTVLIFAQIKLYW